MNGTHIQDKPVQVNAATNEKTTTVTSVVQNKNYKQPSKSVEYKSVTTTKASVTTQKVDVKSTNITSTTQVTKPTATTTTKSVVAAPEINLVSNYNLSQNDLVLMCTVVSSETGYCEDRVQKAVAHTILNRLKSDKFPNTMYEVVTQPNQYTAIHSYFDGQYRSGLYPGSDLWNNSMRLCIEAANEYDFTGNAYAYYNPSMIGYNAWFESLTLTYSDQFGRFFTW